jgi:hypothetical protein
VIRVGTPLPVAQERCWLTQCVIHGTKANGSRSGISVPAAGGWIIRARLFYKKLAEFSEKRFKICDLLTALVLS